MTNKKIYLHFSKNVDDYDTVADKVVMKNDELHEMLVNSIPFSSNKKLQILDLGCGTGHGMKLILKKFPNAQVVGIDFSHKMIIRCKTNLQQFSNRVRLIETNFNEATFDSGYDAIISAIAIHNATHHQKKSLFEKIFKSLNKKGVFINGDFVEGETELINEEYRKIYKKYMEKHLKGHELETWLHHAFNEDMPMSLSGQFSLLKKAGFSNIELKWQYNNVAVYIAQK